ncbi:hypothetical protein [Oribacterium sp. P6A1]|uniref:hypothetical protein n=1 Tax=Oribacterium sp. P6A1 TaxID=1410612 RepID=UPI00055ACA7D|nr:hypothetical protein [Oribacterium sp. P6A1]
MYYDFWVDLPDAPGKYIFEKRGGTTYVKYEYDRIYDPEKQITYPKRATIGKLSDDRMMIQPNQTFLTYIFIERGDYRNQRIGAGRTASIKVEFIENEDKSLCLSQQ